MSFLAPFFLLGGLAVALPVVFHLVRRSAKEQIPFSSLMFLQAAPPRVSKRSRLEHILLLLLRCLALCLLALGFARPYLQRPLTASQPRDTQRKIILLLDTSANMRRQSLWADALARAGQALQKTAPGDQVAILAFDNQVRSLVSFAEWAAMPAEDRAAVLTKRLAGLKPGWGSTRLGPALISAAESFAEADKQGQNIGSRQIVVVTGLPEGSRLDGLQGFDWPRGVEVRVEQVLAQRPTNAGLQWVVDAGDSARSETNTSPRLRVSNSSNARQEQFELRWGGVAGPAPVEVYVPPGQSRVVAAPVLPDNVTGERLVLDGDDDPFDNTVYVVRPKPEQVEILFLGEDSGTDPARPLYYLLRAFQPTRRRVVSVRAVPAASVLSAADLARPRLVVVADPLSDARADALQTLLTNGGSVLCLLQSPAAASVARLAGAPSLAVTDATAPNYAMLGKIDFEHPLFAPFADPRFNDFTKIHFWKYRRVDPASLPGARVIARFDNDDPALLEVPRGKGRLFILTSGWQPADSQMALSSKFVPLLYSLLELSGGMQSQLAQFHIGDSVVLPPSAAGTDGQPVVLLKPDGSSVQLPAGQTAFLDTDLPGLYTVASARPPVRFAVNLDPGESRTAPMSVDELARIGVPLRAPELEPVRQLERKRLLRDAELEGRQKLWRWLTLAALVILLVETWLAGLLSRRTSLQHEVPV